MHSCISIFCNAMRIENSIALVERMTYIYKYLYMAQEPILEKQFEYYSIFHLNERKLQFNAAIYPKSNSLQCCFWNQQIFTPCFISYLSFSLSHSLFLFVEMRCRSVRFYKTLHKTRIAYQTVASKTKKSEKECATLLHKFQLIESTKIWKQSVGKRMEWTYKKKSDRARERWTEKKIGKWANK